MIELHGISRHSELWLPNPLAALHRQFLTSSDGKNIGCKMWVVRKHKTQAQLGAIFGLACFVIKEEFDERGWDTSILLRTSHPTGRPVTIDLLKTFFYNEYPIHNEDGKVITLSDDTCDTKAASTFLDDIMAHASTKWRIYVPSPRPDWKEKE